MLPKKDIPTSSTHCATLARSFPRQFQHAYWIKIVDS